MVEQLTREQMAEMAALHPTLRVAGAQPPVDRSFELPAGLYKATVGAYLGFVLVMGLGFANPEMVLPLAIFVLFIVGGFALPLIWTRLQPDHPVKPKSWARFVAEGVETGSGRTSARDASVQVLILPVLILLWGVLAATIAALV